MNYSDNEICDTCQNSRIEKSESGSVQMFCSIHDKCVRTNDICEKYLLDEKLLDDYKVREKYKMRRLKCLCVRCKSLNWSSEFFVKTTICKSCRDVKTKVEKNQKQIAKRREELGIFANQILEDFELAYTTKKRAVLNVVIKDTKKYHKMKKEFYAFSKTLEVSKDE